MKRGIVWPGEKDQDHQNIRIPLARCQNCGSCLRVLPREILPRKTFSLPVIEKGCRPYTSADPLGPGLRKVVNRMGKNRPAHSTLHRWLSGLGEKTLDRLPSKGGSFIPTSALIAETARGVNAGIRRLWQRRFEIPSWKYRSEKRHDQLKACARTLHAASSLFPDSPFPLTAWNGWLISRFHVAAWTFPAGKGDTPMQLPPPPKRGVGDSLRSKRERKDAKEKARSPPYRLLAVPTH